MGRVRASYCHSANAPGIFTGSMNESASEQSLIEKTPEGPGASRIRMKQEMPRPQNNPQPLTASSATQGGNAVVLHKLRRARMPPNCEDRTPACPGTVIFRSLPLRPNDVILAASHALIGFSVKALKILKKGCAGCFTGSVLKTRRPSCPLRPACLPARGASGHSILNPIFFGTTGLSEATGRRAPPNPNNEYKNKRS